MFPEIASRQHVLDIVPVMAHALSEAGVDWPDLSAMAVTRGPGLAGSLLVGVNAAKAAAWARGLPLVAVNHLEGHLYSNWLDQGGNIKPESITRPSLPELAARGQAFPLLVLIVSGGHTELILMQDHGVYQRLGGTLDDASGEAFDKVARLLGLSYPGGPSVQRAAEGGNPAAFAFPRALMIHPEHKFDFSFSGLKTAVLRQVRALPADNLPVSDLAASFQAAVVDVLAAKTALAARIRRGPRVRLRRRGGQCGPAQGHGRAHAGARFHAAPLPVHRQCGDGRRGRLLSRCFPAPPPAWTSTSRRIWSWLNDS